MTDQRGYFPISESFTQRWGLDATGNWQGLQDDDTGAGMWNLIQNCAANTVNEITRVANSAGQTRVPARRPRRKGCPNSPNGIASCRIFLRTSGGRAKGFVQWPT